MNKMEKNTRNRVCYLELNTIREVESQRFACASTISKTFQNTRQKSHVTFNLKTVMLCVFLCSYFLNNPITFILSGFFFIHKEIFYTFQTNVMDLNFLPHFTNSFGNDYKLIRLKIFIRLKLQGISDRNATLSVTEDMSL